MIPASPCSGPGDDHAVERPAREPPPETEVLSGRKPAQRLRPFRDDPGRKRGTERGRGAPPRRIGEDVEIGQRGSVEKISQLREIGLRLAREADDDVRAEGRIRREAPQLGQDPAYSPAPAARPISRRIRSDACWSERWKCGQTVGLAAMWATSSAPVFLGSRELSLNRASRRRCPRFPEQVEKGRAGLEVLSVGRQVDPGQHDLPEAAAGEVSRLRDDAVRRDAPALPPDGGDDAERAAVVAAVLDLQEGPAAERGVRPGPASVRACARARGTPPPAISMSLAAIPLLGALRQDGDDVGHRRDLGGGPFGQAARDDDPRPRDWRGPPCG